MGICYSIFGDQAATADDTILTIISATTVRPELYYLVFGSAATPADQAYNMQINRFTADGTGSAITPVALDPDTGVTAKATSKDDYTVEPTYTAGSVMLSFSVNLQATYQWYAPPRGRIISPATAANGVGLLFKVVSAGTALCQTTMHFEE
jgi:hypothetical protein